MQPQRYSAEEVYRDSHKGNLVEFEEYQYLLDDYNFLQKDYEELESAHSVLTSEHRKLLAQFERLLRDRPHGINIADES